MAGPEHDEHDALMASLRRRRVATRVVIGLLLVGTVAAVWWNFLRRPSPQQVCAHLDEVRRIPPTVDYRLWIGPISVAGVQSPNAGSFVEQCEWYYGVRRDKGGFFDYGQRARCAMRMTRGDGIVRCDPV